ncbi:fungal-specific transcription factor domain-containing protein [Myxozyma melibiosi]|uniref:Fungal-specific transcription factor domain-containing protein n=1 Tax=Myxozyma melibiosi TaxID=54550 RepID=A0ABR1FCU6_9ASCO
MAKKGLRASIACNHCNAAKSRCDFSLHGSPCSRCRQRNYSDCKPIQSRRGTYDRKEWFQKRKMSAPSISSSAARPPASVVVAEGDADPPAIVSAVSAAATMAVEAADVDSESFSSSNTTSSSPPTGGDRDSASPLDCSPQFTAVNHCNHCPGQINRPHIRSFATKSIDESDSGQTKEWARVFKSLFTNIDKPSKQPLLYFGESFPVSWLLYKVQKDRHGQIRLKQPRLQSGSSGDEDDGESDEEPSNIIFDGCEHPAHMTAAKIAYLSSEKCFSKPSPLIYTQLFSTYFQNIHHFYPIVNRADLARMFDQDSVPWILFYSICFAAASHCPISALCREGGYSTRREARMDFYRRAKSLFDLSYEKNKITLIQSALLLSFWGGQPDDCWNSVSWINMAVNIAESLGMHRQMSSADLPDEDRALWRRIWWSLVARDSFCAALLGKPLRINVSQCDTESLALKDFESDSNPVLASNPAMWGERRVEYGLYVIENAKLGVILRRIVQARDGHLIDTDFVLATHRALQEWERQMPDILRVGYMFPESPLYVYGAALSLVYNHHLVYLHQTAPVDCEISLSIAQEAILDIAEFGSTLVTVSVIPFMPQDTLASFFMAIVMLFTQMQSKNCTRDKLSLFRMQLKICEMIVHQAQDHWDHADWILAISEGLREKLNLQSPQYDTAYQSMWTSNHDNAVSSDARREEDDVYDFAALDEFVQNIEPDLWNPETPGTAKKLAGAKEVTTTQDSREKNHDTETRFITELEKNRSLDCGQVEDSGMGCTDVDSFGSLMLMTPAIVSS